SPSCRARVIRGKEPGRSAFAAGFHNSTLPLQIKVVEKLLAVRGDVVHAEENGALLHVDIVAGGPFHLREWGIGTIPLATGIGRAQRADASVGAAIAKGFVETAERAVIVGDGQQRVGIPAVVKAVRPYADDAE